MTNEVLYDSHSRIRRTNDHECYQPRIHAERVHMLWELSVLTGKPLTWLLDMAIREYYFAMLDWLDANVIEGEAP